MPILFGTGPSGFTFKRASTIIDDIAYAPVSFNSADTALLEPEDRLWQTLPSFYRDFLQNKEIIESVWTATRLLIASEVLNLYQVSYNSSSQDVNTLFQRKWQTLEFNKEFDSSFSYVLVGDASVSYKTVNYEGAYSIQAGEDYAEVSLARLTTGQRSDFVFFGDTYETQYVKEDTSLSWDIEFSLPETGSAHGSFLCGYTSTSDLTKVTNSILAGVRSTSAYKKNLYLCFIDEDGTKTEVVDVSYDLDASKRYKLEAEYQRQSRTLSCVLKEHGATVFPVPTSRSGGSFDTAGVYSASISGITFQGGSVLVYITTTQQYLGTLFSDGRLVVPDLASSAPSSFTIMKVGEEAIPVGAGTSLFTNKFKFPSGSIPSGAVVGNEVKVYTTEMVDTTGDGVKDTVRYRRSDIKSVDTSTGVIELEAAIIQVVSTTDITTYSSGYIPELVYITGFTDLLIDVDGDGVKESKATLSLDIVGTSIKYDFQAESFGLVGFNGSAFYPIPEKALNLYSWNYSWPVTTNTIAYLPSLRTKITDTTGQLVYGSDYLISGNRILFTQPNRGSYYAEYIVYDEDTLYNNFGYILGLQKEGSTADYKAKIRALLFSLLKGPTVDSIRSGFGLYLGLPITEHAGEVTKVNDSFSTNEGQIVITSDGLPYTYYYSKRAGTSLTVGDTVEQFQILSDGIEYHDYVSSPLDIARVVGTDIEKFHTMLFDFNLTKIDPVKLPEASKFIDRIKPTYKNKIVRGVLEALDIENIQESLTIDITQELLEPFCSFPQPRYDNRFYVDQTDFDYAYDQFTDDFLPAGGIASIDSSEDGVPSATILLSRDFTHLQLSSVYSNNTLREFVTGVLELTSGSTTAVGVSDVHSNSTAFSTEISPTISGLSAGQVLFLILHPYYEGTGATATQYSNLLEGSAGDFDDLAVGDIVVLKNLQIDTDSDGVVDADSLYDNGSFMVAQTFGAGATSVELTHAFVNRPTASSDTYTNISWYAFKPQATAVEVSSITDETNLELNTAVPAAYDPDAGTKYLATMADPNFAAVYYDYFEEYCPNETLALYFGSDFSESTDSSSVTAVYNPVGLSYPPSSDGTSTYPKVNNTINYTEYNRFHNYDSFSVTTDGAARDEITLNDSMLWLCSVGDWIAFPMLPNTASRNGLTAEDTTGTTQGEDEVAFTTETVTRSGLAINPHYLGFSWHRVTSVTGSYSASNPQIYPSLSTDIGTQTSVDSGLIHISHPNTSPGIAIGSLSSGSSPFTLTFKYAGNVSTYPGDYDPDNPSRDDAYILDGMFLLAVKLVPNWDSSTDEVDVILQVVDGTHVHTGNSNEFTISVRIWGGSSHSTIKSSFTNTGDYQLCPIDFTHPLQQDESNTPSGQHTTSSLASKKGMSEIFDVESEAGSLYNSSEVVTATSGTKIDGTINATIVEATP